MAKRAPIDDQQFSPVKSGLVHAVLSERVIPGVSAGAHAHRARALLIAPRDPRESSCREAAGCETGQQCGQLTREKRVLISRAEEVALNELVHHLSSNGATSLKLSHLLRACVLVLRHCEKELIERVHEAPHLIRPANDNPSALREFERSLAQRVAFAIRLAPPMA